MKVIDKKLTEITPYAQNPRKNDEAVDKVAASIQEFGFKQPIVVDKDGTIIVGHTRYKAAQKLGLETVPVLVADDLTEEQAKAYRLADNKTNEFAEWDFELLDLELFDIDDIDMERFGFDTKMFSESAFTDSAYSEDITDEYADIEKLERHYGVPYQGNKSRIADIIINILPKGERLVDLFGGGVR